MPSFVNLKSFHAKLTNVYAIYSRISISELILTMTEIGRVDGNMAWKILEQHQAFSSLKESVYKFHMIKFCWVTS